MLPTHSIITELGQGASQVLNAARKMAMRGDSRLDIERYLADCRDCFLKACQETNRFVTCDLLDDIVRALRHAGPDAELIGALAVLAGVAHQEESTDFHSFSLTAQQRVRAEVRDHCRLGVCDISDIKLGAELALSSLQPLVAA